MTIYVSDTPAPDALAWSLRSAGTGGLLACKCLAGATSSSLWRLRVEGGGRELNLVLRLFTKAEWLAEEPDLARHEAASLERAGLTRVSVPELTAVDEDGSECGVPAVLMTALPGEVVLRPRSMDRWLKEMAEALARIHAAPADRHAWRYRTYNDVQALHPPTWSARRREWERAIEIVQGPRPRPRACFIHRDYHPTNVLWEGDLLSGVVDWVNACLGAPGIDVGHCRLNLAGLHGPDVADGFLLAYRQAAGGAFGYDPYWDLLSLIECLPGPDEVYSGWPAFGVRDLTVAIMRERLDEYVSRVAAEVG